MRLTNVLAVADSLLARGARGVVMFNRFFEPDIDVERMTFVNGDPFSEPAELRNVLRSVALCTTAVPQLDVSVSTGVHDGEAAVKALLCGANAVQICSAIHEQGYGVIVDINRLHRPVGRAPRLRVAGRVPRQDGLRQRRKRRVPARAVYEIFSARCRVTFAGSRM